MPGGEEKELFISASSALSNHDRRLRWAAGIAGILVLFETVFEIGETRGFKRLKADQVPLYRTHPKPNLRPE